MFRHLHTRAGHVALIVIAGGLLFFPNLGGHSLWDVDEAHNAECAREMRATGDNWRVPTFNYALRTDKPALLYWLIWAAYDWFGVTEFAARFWSAVCGVGSMLVTYALGRRLFSPATGLLGALVLGSSIMFCIASHAATPDALLIFFVLLTLFFFWCDYQDGRDGWLVWTGASAALAVLAKGPVGLLLPAAVIVLFLAWERRLRLLLKWQYLVGCLIFGVLALPWYIAVTVETKRQFLWGFFLRHNVERFLGPMDGHSGWVIYHPLALLAAFAPWSAFLGLTVWSAVGRRARDDRLPPAYRFLWCWLGLWLVFFSLAGTKLPNYLLPAYPALALLTARFLVRWQAGAIGPGHSLMGVALGCLALVGVVVGGGLLAASGVTGLVPLRGRELPELAPWAAAGLLPVAAAVWAWRWLRREQRGWAVGVVAVACMGMVGLLAAFGPAAVDGRKLPKQLAAEIERHMTGREAAVGCYHYYQPSLVFYTRRQVVRFDADQEALDHLHSPTQAFLLVPREHWARLSALVDAPCRVVTHRSDFVTGQNVLLITNQGPAGGGQARAGGIDQRHER
jgi:4-amino-4-deoxy-L-arabinose transferase-like glycosyltransferase